MQTKTLAALQLGSSPLGKGATLQDILSFEPDITAQEIDLLVMPEALLGGYPKGSAFGTYLDYRKAVRSTQSITRMPLMYPDLKRMNWPRCHQEQERILSLA